MSNIKWLTAAFEGMGNFSLMDHVWDPKMEKWMRVFNSFIMKKMLTGLIEPIFFLSKKLSYTIVLFGNICYNGSQEGLT